MPLIALDSFWQFMNRQISHHFSICLQSIFPSGSNLFSNASAAYQKKWEKMPPAWAHADSAKDKEDKIELLASGQFWKVVEEDPMPQCARHALIPKKT